MNTCSRFPAFSQSVSCFSAHLAFPAAYYSWPCFHVISHYGSVFRRSPLINPPRRNADARWGPWRERRRLLSIPPMQQQLPPPVSKRLKCQRGSWLAAAEMCCMFVALVISCDYDNRTWTLQLCSLRNEAQLILWVCYQTLIPIITWLMLKLILCFAHKVHLRSFKCFCF